MMPWIRIAEGPDEGRPVYMFRGPAADSLPLATSGVFTVVRTSGVEMGLDAGSVEICVKRAKSRVVIPRRVSWVLLREPGVVLVDVNRPMPANWLSVEKVHELATMLAGEVLRESGITAGVGEVELDVAGIADPDRIVEDIDAPTHRRTVMLGVRPRVRREGLCLVPELVVLTIQFRRPESKSHWIGGDQ
ncbi:MAG: hypothetical protein QM809_11355 [Gordonia sp. (in: high G+C Gram-positive bacteria)]|uniref:hypothetical protein n=1 Tax=Gordonia sp. (in: high G+C Gram-positive bacteria) TaxID=84139 RepID=UPI0039E4C841